jgi:hypothetical protein
MCGASESVWRVGVRSRVGDSDEDSESRREERKASREEQIRSVVG